MHSIELWILRFDSTVSIINNLFNIQLSSPDYKLTNKADTYQYCEYCKNILYNLDSTTDIANNCWYFSYISNTIYPICPFPIP